MPSSLSDILRLDVSGVAMTTTRATLLSEPNSVLARMFAEDSALPPARVEGGAYFLDLDAGAFKVMRLPSPRLLFQVVLHWLRHRTLRLPPSVPRAAVADIANYLGLAGLQEELAPPRPTTGGPTLSRLALVPGPRAWDPSVPSVLSVDPSGQCSDGGRAVGVNKMGNAHNGTICYIGLCDSTLDLYKYNIAMRDWVVATPADARILSLHLHQEEVKSWVPGEADSVPSRALPFPETGKLRYLGYVKEGDSCIPGMVLEGIGIRLNDDRVLTDGYYVLTVSKKYQMYQI
jgi:hypothetical protein